MRCVCVAIDLILLEKLMTRYFLKSREMRLCSTLKPLDEVQKRIERYIVFEKFINTYL